MKNFSKFKTINENKYADEDFEFVTKLENVDLTIYGHPFSKVYDDHETTGTAHIFWELQFDWMGDAGIEVNVVVKKVVLNLMFTLFEGDDLEKEEEKEFEKTIEGVDFGKLETNQTMTFGSIQYSPQGLEYSFDEDYIEVYF